MPPRCGASAKRTRPTAPSPSNSTGPRVAVDDRRLRERADRLGQLLGLGLELLVARAGPSRCGRSAGSSCVSSWPSSAWPLDRDQHAARAARVGDARALGGEVPAALEVAGQRDARVAQAGLVAEHRRELPSRGPRARRASRARGTSTGSSLTTGFSVVHAGTSVGRAPPPALARLELGAQLDQRLLVGLSVTSHAARRGDARRRLERQVRSRRCRRSRRPSGTTKLPLSNCRRADADARLEVDEVAVALATSSGRGWPTTSFTSTSVILYEIEYGFGAPGISSSVIARFISSAIASRSRSVTGLRRPGRASRAAVFFASADRRRAEREERDR